MTITCHFLTETWELKSLVLETLLFELSHAAENIANSLRNAAKKWNISENIIAIVTDNASNVVAAVKILGWNHVPCFAHTLNLVVSEAIKSDECVSEIKKMCKQIVTFFHQSVKATEKLKEVQNKLNLPEHKLIQEVDTKWNSTFFMFSCIFEQHDAITTAPCLSGRNDLFLAVDDFQLLKASLSVLQLFETATREISADKYLSISRAIPLTRSLFTAIERAHLLAISTILDPRLKKFAFSNREASRQAEQWVFQEARAFILPQLNTKRLAEDEGDEPEKVSKSPGL
ncbi:zinc finger BED domain-containing protein 4-like [Dendronephthya gigantea]|uniref:zinc finger BED domain-containing protein 4-like n=1 Tax=Dendronephthya gigantea TaxID=151771 RepID=UPI00106CDA10|nr:zinc finger BED domain-containing protein 4-like [Dendronephthya gigantea]